MNTIEIDTTNVHSMNHEFEPDAWMKLCLWVAAVVHLIGGAIAMLFPDHMLQWLVGESGGIATTLWQCIGCFVAIMGLGYLFTARNACQQRLFIWLAIVQQAILFLGSLWVVMSGALPPAVLWFSTGLGVVWTIPMVLILWRSIRYAHAFGSAHIEPEADEPLVELRTNTGKLLDELADAKPQLVVFLRHAGCTFCRQALADIRDARQQIEDAGCGIVFVHLGKEDDAASLEVFKKYQVDDLPRISDPSCRLYRQFGLDLGGFPELFGLRVWIRGFLFGVVNGHGIGAIRGNSFQMPGAYLYHGGMVLSGFRHETAADRPDYVALARQVSVNSDCEVRCQT